MTSYGIWWDDLTEEAQERLADLCDDNVDLLPLAIINIEDEEEDEQEEE